MPQNILFTSTLQSQSASGHSCSMARPKLPDATRIIPLEQLGLSRRACNHLHRRGANDTRQLQAVLEALRPRDGNRHYFVVRAGLACTRNSDSNRWFSELATLRSAPRLCFASR